jgi:PAS domain S-box-containing protein
LIRELASLREKITELEQAKSERKRAEEERSRVNRALRMLSNTNQAVIHITDEATLLNEVCRIAVEVGGYRLAWVGFAEYDEAKTLRPAAHAGFDSEYIESAKVTWADNERGRGPGGTAIRTGQPCIVRNIPVDPSFAPWREEATRRGYKSIIALPLTIEGQAFGAIGIYSAEADAFDDREVEILKELADDLAFGINALRTRAERDLAEEALQKSEEKYKGLAEKSIAGVYVVQEGKFRFINSNAASYAGYTREELLEQEASILVHPEDSERVRQNARAMLLGEMSSPYEFRIITKQGETRWIMETVTSIFHEGRPAILGNSMNITERRCMEEALRENQSRLAGIVTFLPDATLAIDKEMRIIIWNKAIEEMTGVPAAEMIGKGDYAYTIPFYGEARPQLMDLVFLDRMEIASRYPNITREGDSLTAEAFCKALYNNKGAWVFAKASPLHDQFGKIIGAIESIRDITERKRAEEALSKSEGRLHALVQTIPDLIWLKDKDGVYLSCNTMFERFFGAREADIVGKTDYDFVGRELADFFREHDRKAMAAEKPTSNEEWITFADDGHRALLDTIKTPMYDARGTLVGVLGIGRDITERKRAEDMLRISEGRYRLAEAIGHVGNWEYNLQTTKFWGSDEAKRIYGFNPEALDFSTDEVENCIPERERVHQALVDLIEADKPYNLEFEIHPKDSLKPRIISSVAALKRDEYGNPLLVTGLIQDITERKQAEEKLHQTLESLKKAIVATVQLMVSAVESRDPYTAGHQTRSSDLARAIATEMGLPQEKVDGIRMAGSIHDIGKLSIPAEILSKPAKLTNIEFSLIKEHARQGYEMLKDVESPWPMAEIVYQHHERMDGSGYPRNLIGDEILVEARILAVADVVESMASHRPYRPALGLNAALAEIENNKGTLYDAAAVDVCLRLFREKCFQLKEA